jgi:hypothetical protein
MLVCCRKGKRSNKHLFLIRLFKVILHQFWVKKIFPWKFNLENGGIFTKLFMHVSSRNMFPTTRNLQIHVHVYGPRHCCGDWINFRLFCSDDCRSWSREEKSHLNNHGCFVNTHTFLTMIIEESVCFMSCESILFAIILMWYTRIYFFSINWKPIISPKEFKSGVTRISFVLLYGKIELSVVKYVAICS